MAIGDNFNDVSMLKVAGASFAVANAEDGVKEFAKYLTSKNSENGVAEAIMRCINENL
jgi:hydroxymethylpyrimidine pyrophosphatase-like HAD family hydrolase